MSGTTRKRPRKPPAGGARGGQRPRLGARVAAVQALFQSEASGESAETVLDQFVRHRLGDPPEGRDGGYEEGRVPAADVPLFAAILRGVGRNAATLDPIVASHLAAGWTMDRLDPVLRALLRAACAELWAGSDPPARVVINEYMDVAHGFFDGEEPRFANGVLNALAHRLRPDEFAPAEPAAPAPAAT